MLLLPYHFHSPFVITFLLPLPHSLPLFWARSLSYREEGTVRLRRRRRQPMCAVAKSAATDVEYARSARGPGDIPGTGCRGRRALTRRPLRLPPAGRDQQHDTGTAGGAGTMGRSRAGRLDTVGDPPTRGRRTTMPDHHSPRRPLNKGLFTRAALTTYSTFKGLAARHVQREKLG